MTGVKIQPAIQDIEVVVLALGWPPAQGLLRLLGDNRSSLPPRLARSSVHGRHATEAARLLKLKGQSPLQVCLFDF